MSWISKVFKVLGKLTDILSKGRDAGLWTENPSVPGKLGKPHDPTFPDVK